MTTTPNAWRSFPEARNFARSLHLNSSREWKRYCKSGKKPDDIPNTPDCVYKKQKQWKGWADWLGSHNLATKDRSIRPWSEAREYIHKLGLGTVRDWYKYCRSGKRPDDIPYNPNTVYKDCGWKGYPDFLGVTKLQYRSWPEARDYVHKLGLKSQDEWIDYCKSGKLPKDIPKSPEFYKEWKGTKDWLGYDFRPWAEARKWAHTQGFASQNEFRKYCKSGKLPKDIPKRPEVVYKEEWKGWGDFLGTGRKADQETGWSIDRVKQLLRYLIESKIIYEWDEAVLYSLLLRRGVLNLDHKSRYSKLFKQLDPS